MTPLTPKRRSELRAEAHKLRPLVLIGDKGLTDEVLAEIDGTLRAHELIKVRAATNEREARDAWLDTICERLQAHPVQQIGKIFVIYRENPEEGRKAEVERLRKVASTPRGEVVSERGRQAQRSRDARKVRERDIADMVTKGKIPAKVKLDPEPDLGPGQRREDTRADGGTTGTSRPRSRAPSPRPESEPPRRRPRSSR